MKMDEIHENGKRKYLKGRKRKIVRNRKIENSLTIEIILLTSCVTCVATHTEQKCCTCTHTHAHEINKTNLIL